MAESVEELKSLLMKVKEKSEKSGLKLIIQKTKIMASDPINFMANSWGNNGNSDTLFSWKSFSYVWPLGLCSPWNSPGQNTGVDSYSLLQGIFLTQGLKPGLLRCRQSLYQLSHKRSPRILEWVASPFSIGLLDPGIRVFCFVGKFFTNWAVRAAP